MKPVFHTQIALSMAEMPRKTKTMVSEPLAKTFMTYLTVMTDFSSMFALMYFWQHIPQKRTLQDKNTFTKFTVAFINTYIKSNKFGTNNIINEMGFFP